MNRLNKVRQTEKAEKAFKHAEAKQQENANEIADFNEKQRRRAKELTRTKVYEVYQIQQFLARETWMAPSGCPLVVE